MFWAWEKHQEWRKAMREEGRKEARKEIEQRYMPVLKRIAQEKGLTLDELLEQERLSSRVSSRRQLTPRRLKNLIASTLLYTPISSLKPPQPPTGFC